MKEMVLSMHNLIALRRGLSNTTYRIKVGFPVRNADIKLTSERYRTSEKCRSRAHF